LASFAQTEAMGTITDLMEANLRHGWHAFRRRLAINLYRLGVPDKRIQAILRHANLGTTMNIYVKNVDADSVRAMKALEKSVRRIVRCHPTPWTGKEG
jgi:integrase